MTRLPSFLLARVRTLDSSDLGIVLVGYGVGGFDWRLGCIAVGVLLVSIPVFLVTRKGP